MQMLVLVSQFERLFHFRRMAFAVTESKGVAHPFDKNKGMALAQRISGQKPGSIGPGTGSYKHVPGSWLQQSSGRQVLRNLEGFVRATWGD